MKLNKIIDLNIIPTIDKVDWQKKETPSQFIWPHKLDEFHNLSLPTGLFAHYIFIKMYNVVRISWDEESVKDPISLAENDGDFVLYEFDRYANDRAAMRGSGCGLVYKMIWKR